MKFMILSVALMLGVISASAQRMQMSPAERAERLKDSLGLSAGQMKGVVQIYEEMDQQRKDLFSSGPTDRQSRMDAMRSIMDKGDTKIKALLTPAQKLKYEAMIKQRQERRFQRSRGD